MLSLVARRPSPAPTKPALGSPRCVVPLAVGPAPAAHRPCNPRPGIYSPSQIRSPSVYVRSRGAASVTNANTHLRQRRPRPASRRPPIGRRLRPKSPVPRPNRPPNNPRRVAPSPQSPRPLPVIAPAPEGPVPSLNGMSFPPLHTNTTSAAARHCPSIGLSTAQSPRRACASGPSDASVTVRPWRMAAMAASS